MRAVAGLVGALLFVGGCAADIDRRISDLGLMPVKRPSAEFAPGTVVHDTSERSMFSPARFDGTIACPSTSFAGNLVPSRAIGAEVAASQALSGTVDVTAHYKDKIEAAAGAGVHASVTLKLQNVTVLDIDDASIFNGLADQSPGCTQALLDGNDMFYVARALQADAVYTVSFGAGGNLSASVKEQAAKAVDGAASAALVAEDTYTVTGKGLFWGVSIRKATQVPSTVVLGVSGPGTRRRELMQNCTGGRVYATRPPAQTWSDVCSAASAKWVCDEQARVLPVCDFNGTRQHCGDWGGDDTRVVTCSVKK